MSHMSELDAAGVSVEAMAAYLEAGGTFEEGLKVLACTHNEMVHTGDKDHAWKCALCGYVYGEN